MAKDNWIVYALGKGKVTPYEPKLGDMEKKPLNPGTLRYELADFIRIGLGLPSLDDAA